MQLDLYLLLSVPLLIKFTTYPVPTSRTYFIQDHCFFYHCFPMKMESLLLELENTKCYFLQRDFDLAFSSCASVHQCRCVIMHLVEYGPVRVYLCVKEIIFSIDEYLLDGNGFIKKGKYIGKLTGNIKRAQRRKILINSRIKSQMEVLCRQRI